MKSKKQLIGEINRLLNDNKIEDYTVTFQNHKGKLVVELESKNIKAYTQRMKGGIA